MRSDNTPFHAMLVLSICALLVGCGKQADAPSENHGKTCNEVRTRVRPAPPALSQKTRPNKAVAPAQPPPVREVRMPVHKSDYVSSEVFHVKGEPAGPVLLWRAAFEDFPTAGCVPGVSRHAAVLKEGTSYYARFEPIQTWQGGKRRTVDTLDVNVANGHLNANWFGTLDIRVQFRMCDSTGGVQLMIKERGYRRYLEDGGKNPWGKRVEFWHYLIDFAPGRLVVTKVLGRNKRQSVTTRTAKLRTNQWADIRLVEKDGLIRIFLSDTQLHAFKVPRGCGGSCFIKSRKKNDFKKIAIYELTPRPYHFAFESLRK